MCGSMRARSGCTSERAARESVGRECGCARAGASADVYSKCQGCNCASEYECARANGTGLRDNGGRRRGQLLFCHAWLRFIRATLFHRKTRAFKCFCQPTAAQCYKREDSQFIDRIDEERGFFFISHRDVENWSIKLELFFNSKCHQRFVAFESLIRFV